MSNIVLLCPGQGAQAVGMAKAWCDASPSARAILDEADRIFADVSKGGPDGRTLSDIAFNGPQETLNRTDLSQPALFTAAVACYHALPDELRALPIRAVAGLSLGEYTALHLAGAFSFEDGLRLVMRRGQLMQQAAESSKGGMVALIGADEAQANEVCARATAEGGVLVPANFNAPGQIVLSGGIEACDRAVAVAGDVGVRATKLQVAGAVHTPLMQPAADRMYEALSAAQISSPVVPVITNVRAEPCTDPEIIRALLVEQVTGMVRWRESVQKMDELGVTQIVEIGAGQVLTGLTKRIAKDVMGSAINTPENLEGFKNV
jgi:[acyl-carrier-protein] S-malonyltransferase